MCKHPFGDHSSCLDWCSHRKDPHKPYKHLPNGKCLTDRNLQKALADVFSKYKSHCKKIARLGSTQSNESLNNLIASKAPKEIHFSGSANLNYRVSAAIAQKNIGHNYVSKVRFISWFLLGHWSESLWQVTYCDGLASDVVLLLLTSFSQELLGQS